MRILQLCHKIPQPARDGGTVAMQQMTDFFLELGWTVKVFAVATDKHPPQWDAIPAEYIKATAFECCHIHTRFDPFKAAASILSGKSYNVSRFYSKSFADKLRNILSQSHYDLVVLEGLYLTPYIETIRRCSKSKIILRAHNAEHQIWFRMAESESNPIKKIGLYFLAQTLKSYEIKAALKCDALLAISLLTQDFFLKNGFKGPSAFIPVSAPNLSHTAINFNASMNRVFHLGSMDWMPNLEGLLWFLKKVWPLVLKQEPAMVFHVAGKNLPQWFAQSQWPQVVVDGEVPDAATYAQDKGMMVVPLLSGSGMRVKIIEGLAWGKTIITTSVGAEGTGCMHNQHLLIADSPEDMTALIVECCRNPQKAASLAIQGNAYVQNHYNPQAIAKKLESFCKRLIPQPEAQPNLGSSQDTHM